MSRYVDGYVLPLKKDKIESYRETATKAGQIWKEHGALEYIECVGEDFNAAEMTSFTELAKAKDDETVIFAWIVYKTRQHRDEVNEKVMNDPRLHEACSADKNLFDFKRMTFGGFQTIVEA